MQRARSRVIATSLPLAFSLLITGCGPDSKTPPAPLTRVRAMPVAFSDFAPSVRLTGEIQPRDQSDISFRVGGRLTERAVDVGDHVVKGQLLAKLDPAEQQASISSAQASVDAAEARVRQTKSTFDRQSSLLERGFTTRKDFDLADEDYRTAQSSLEAARADLESAQENLSDTVLTAKFDGLVTARDAEVGQVVQAAEPVFSIARDGPRDAVFDVQEVILSDSGKPPSVNISLVSDPNVKAVGQVHEVAPIVDPNTGTVRVKVELMTEAPLMTLGSAVVGQVTLPPQKRVLVPWSALAAQGGKPAVWLVDPTSKTVNMRSIDVERYDVGTIVVRGGLEPGQVVVTAGSQFMRPGQQVELAEGPTP